MIFVSENYKSMVSKIRAFQKTLPEKVMQLRDLRANVDSNFSEFIMVLKQSLPQSVKEIQNLAEFEGHVKSISSLTGLYKVAVLKDYIAFLESSKQLLVDMRNGIMHRMKQVHSKCETKAQKYLKKHMDEMFVEGLGRLERDYDIRKLKHVEWQGKLTANEASLFEGLFSLMSYCMDAVVDLDQLTDEYMSGVRK